VPIVNGRFHINPAHGRAVERARLARAERNALPRHRNQEDEQSGHWVTINGRHVLIDEAQAGRASRSARDRIAATAEKHSGSTAWAYAKRKANFPVGTNKCNKFVYDVTKEAGAEATTIGSDGKPRPPLAAEWADPNAIIPGWRLLGPNETPEPGDVAAYKLPGGGTRFTGHPGIVTSVGANGTVHAIAAHESVVGPDEKFQPRRGIVTYHRYAGDQR